MEFYNFGDMRNDNDTHKYKYVYKCVYIYKYVHIYVCINIEYFFSEKNYKLFDKEELLQF